jgi:hypothetical protein
MKISTKICYRCSKRKYFFLTGEKAKNFREWFLWRLRFYGIVQCECLKRDIKVKKGFVESRDIIKGQDRLLAKKCPYYLEHVLWSK